MAISVNLYLDTRTSKKVEPTDVFPVKIGITKNCSTTYITTGIKVRKSQWKNHEVIGRPDKAQLNAELAQRKADVLGIIQNCRCSNRYADMSVTDIKKDVLKRMPGHQAPSNKPLFLSLFDKYAERRSSDRTKEIYRASARKIRKLIHDAEYLSIEDISLEWLEDYDNILSELGNMPATRSIELRNIRAVVRHAIKHKIIHDNPFEFFEFPVAEKRKRALAIEELRALHKADVHPWEQKYVDFFMLSFMLRGINTEDLLHLTCTCIDNGRINYMRAKTHVEISVKVEPECMELIEKYRGEKYLLNILDTYSCTHNWTSKVDDELKDIASRIGLPPITMYWARHTWATLAFSDLKIPLSTVSDALGHKQERNVTSTYIDKEDYTQVDKANRKAIDYLFANKKGNRKP